MFGLASLIPRTHTRLVLFTLIALMVVFTRIIASLTLSTRTCVAKECHGYGSLCLFVPLLSGPAPFPRLASSCWLV